MHNMTVEKKKPKSRDLAKGDLGIWQPENMSIVESSHPRRTKKRNLLIAPSICRRRLELDARQQLHVVLEYPCRIPDCVWDVPL
jgi:hypothetical protein